MTGANRLWKDEEGRCEREVAVGEGEEEEDGGGGSRLPPPPSPPDHVDLVREMLTNLK